MVASSTMVARSTRVVWTSDVSLKHPVTRLGSRVPGALHRGHPHFVLPHWSSPLVLPIASSPWRPPRLRPPHCDHSHSGDVRSNEGALRPLIAVTGVRSPATGHVYGVDLTRKQLDRAPTTCRRRGLTHVEFREGRIEALPLDDASVDCVGIMGETFRDESTEPPLAE